MMMVMTASAGMIVLVVFTVLMRVILVVTMSVLTTAAASVFVMLMSMLVMMLIVSASAGTAFLFLNIAHCKSPLKFFHYMVKRHRKNLRDMSIIEGIVHHSPLLAAFHDPGHL